MSSARRARSSKNRISPRGSGADADQVRCAAGTRSSRRSRRSSAASAGVSRTSCSRSRSTTSLHALRRARRGSSPRRALAQQRAAATPEVAFGDHRPVDALDDLGCPSARRTRAAPASPRGLRREAARGARRSPAASEIGSPKFTNTLPKRRCRTFRARTSPSMLSSFFAPPSSSLDHRALLDQPLVGDRDRHEEQVAAPAGEEGLDVPRQHAEPRRERLAGARAPALDEELLGEALLDQVGDVGAEHLLVERIVEARRRKKAPARRNMKPNGPKAMFSRAAMCGGTRWFA